MSFTFTSSDSLSCLEEYAIALTAGMLSLRSLESYHIKALQIGILDEDSTELAKSICWECRRLMKLYMQQAEDVFDILPPSFSQEEAIKILNEQFINNPQK